LDKPGYTLEFCEPFQGPSLDTGKWLPYGLPQRSSRTLGGIEPSPAPGPVR